jgi:hypothetical protein
MSGDQDVDAALLRYLIEHPDAMDTADGIAAFWLSNQITVREVARALDRLVARDAVVVCGTAQRPMFRLKSHDGRTM